MTTDQMTLLEGDALSQHRFVLGAILEDALRLLRTATTATGPATEYELTLALDLVRQVSDELRRLPGEEPVPF